MYCKNAKKPNQNEQNKKIVLLQNKEIRCVYLVCT